MDEDEIERDLPSFVRAAEVRANSFDEENLTIELVWSTGAGVRRYDWRSETYYLETLDMKPGSIRLDRLNGGAPFLDSHSSWSLRSVIGSVVPGSARVEGGKGHATVKLSRAEADADTVSKIRDGIIRNVSVGYIIHRVKKIAAKDDNSLPEWRAVDWEPMEISAVPIPADPKSQIRSAPDANERTFPCVFVEAREAVAAAENTEKTMTEEERLAAEAAAAAARAAETDTGSAPAAPAPAATPAPAARAAEPAADPEAVTRAARQAADEAVRAERQRAATIREMGASVGVPEFGERHALEGTSLEDFRNLLIDHMAARQKEQPQIQPEISARATVSVVEPERRAAAIESALLHRGDSSVELSEDARDFRGMRLIDVARHLLEARGVNTRNMSDMEVARDATLPFVRSGGMMSTSDFSNILSAVANKSLRAAYEAAPNTYAPLVRMVTVPDFKAVHRVQLGEAPQLEKVNEHGEFKRGSLSDAGESYKVETFGKIIALSRQSIINDDLGALTRIPRMFGVQAAALEGDLVWAQIIGNPKMADNVTLFHNTHKNLGTAAAIGKAGISAARKAMSLQTGLDGKTVLNLSPAHIIVPPSLETDVDSFLADITPAKTEDAIPRKLRTLNPISEPRLELGVARFEIAGSATNWYLAASVNQIDLVELAYLEGSPGLHTETRTGFDVDGLELKVRLDAGAKTIDHRGFYKNPFAG